MDAPTAGTDPVGARLRRRHRVLLVAVRYLSEAGIVSAELQTLLWFGVTLAGVALLGGEIASWRRIDQLVALGVMLGIGWLLVGTGANPSDGR
ncbi:MAG: hypothetical protein WKH64_06565 [Chloroflexia bacterium]